MHKKSTLYQNDFNQFNATLDKIMSSLLDLVNVYENLIPEELAEKGLKSTIESLCKAIETEKKVKISLTQSGNFIRLEEIKEVTLFKILNAILTFSTSQPKTTAIHISVLQDTHLYTILIIYNGDEINLSGLSSSGIKEIARIKSLIESSNGSFTFSRTSDSLNLVKVEILI